MEFNFIVTSTKNNKSWRDLKKFQDDFGDYCKFMGYCPLIIYTPIKGGNALEVAVKNGSIPYKNVEDFVEDLASAYPNYSFDC